jgi:hypothetical protein
VLILFSLSEVSDVVAAPTDTVRDVFAHERVEPSKFSKSIDLSTNNFIVLDRVLSFASQIKASHTSIVESWEQDGVTKIITTTRFPEDKNNCPMNIIGRDGAFQVYCVKSVTMQFDVRSNGLIYELSILDVDNFPDKIDALTRVSTSYDSDMRGSYYIIDIHYSGRDKYQIKSLMFCFADQMEPTLDKGEPCYVDLQSQPNVNITARGSTRKIRTPFAKWIEAESKKYGGVFRVTINFEDDTGVMYSHLLYRDGKKREQWEYGCFTDARALFTTECSFDRRRGYFEHLRPYVP